MTQEEKARAYDEAIKRANQMLSIGKTDARDHKVVLSFFPELAESDDERIREDIIQFLYAWRRDSKVERWLAWLEKQNHVAHKYNVGATIYYNSFGTTKSMVVANVVDTDNGNPMYEDTDGHAVFEKDLIELEWSDEDENIIKELTCVFERIVNDGVSVDISVRKAQKWIVWLKFLCPQKRWKPSEEQMEALGWAAKCPSSIYHDILSKLHDDLKAL